MNFSHYAPRLDKMCLAYYGLCHEYLIYLSWIKKYIEKSNPDISVTIGSRDSGCKWIEEITESPNKIDFGIYNEFKTGMISPHPIEVFSAGIDISVTPLTKVSRLCAIITKGEPPNRSLTATELIACQRLAIKWGMETRILDGGFGQTDKLQALLPSLGGVIGAESAITACAAYNGLKVGLVPTGYGTKLLKLMRPDIEILATA